MENWLKAFVRFDPKISNQETVAFLTIARKSDDELGCSVRALQEEMGMTSDQTGRALAYWVEKGFIERTATEAKPTAAGAEFYRALWEA